MVFFYFSPTIGPREVYLFHSFTFQFLIYMKLIICITGYTISDLYSQCESCGMYGLVQDFRSSGRFCSQRCVGVHASLSRADKLARQSGEVVGTSSPKSKKRKNNDEITDQVS